MHVMESFQLTKTYENKKAVDRVDFKVEKGELFGFLGSNGAGKSTFINMLTGIIQPSSGSYKILNHDQKALDKVKKNIGVLPEYSSFFGDLTPLQHLKFFCRLLHTKKTNSEYLYFLERVGLEKAKNIKVRNFSFGMKKKLGIAQAIVHDPSLIILDEPTSGVDADSILKIHALLKELNKEGKTIFITSHNLDEVQKLCTRIAIMKDGRIISEGTMADLRKQYQSTLSVKIRHAAISSDLSNQLRYVIQEKGKITTWDNQHLVVDVQGEHIIPKILKSLFQANVDIYSVDLNQPSLEEIFLKENQDKNEISH